MICLCIFLCVYLFICLQLERCQEETEHLEEARRHLEYAHSQSKRPLQVSHQNDNDHNDDYMMMIQRCVHIMCSVADFKFYECQSVSLASNSTDWGRCSQVPQLTWKSVGWTNPPGAGKKTLELHNSNFFNGDHQKLMLIGKLHSWRSYWCWFHSLIFIGFTARSSFGSPPVCNFAMAVTVLLDLLIFITCICDQKHFHISWLPF